MPEELWLRDYTAAEHRWLERRQWETQNKFATQAAALQRKQLNAQRVNNAAQLASLRLQQQQLQIQRAEAERAAAEEAKRDLQAYAMWRQTPEGQHFVQWTQRAGQIINWIATMQRRWGQAWDDSVAQISQQERTSFEKKRFIQHTDRQRQKLLLRNIGIGLALAGMLLVCVHGLFGLLFFAGIPLALYGQIASTDPQWAAANAAEGARQQQLREARFGWDPLAEPARRPPSWAASGDPLSYGQLLHETILHGIVGHPAPDQLPQLAYPSLIPAGSVTLAELRAVLLNPAQTGTSSAR